MCTKSECRFYILSNSTICQNSFKKAKENKLQIFDSKARRATETTTSTTTPSTTVLFYPVASVEEACLARAADNAAGPRSGCAK